MNRKQQLNLVIGLGLAGVLGLAIVAAAQMATTGSRQQQYEQQLKKIDRNKADDLYRLARWCFQNELTGEAKALAVETLQKAPDDVRAKYLLYVLTSGASTEVVTETGGVEAEATITEADVEAVYKNEGDDKMAVFRNKIQGVLIQTCGAPKCHGGGNANAKWSLIRRNTLSRKTIAENFRSINKFINRGDDAPTSRLLMMPLKGKGGGHPEIVFTRGEADPVYQTILTWIRSLKTATTKIWGEAGKSPVPTTTP
jgi:hypothetical protein